MEFKRHFKRGTNLESKLPKVKHVKAKIPSPSPTEFHIKTGVFGVHMSRYSAEMKKIALGKEGFTCGQEQVEEKECGALLECHHVQSAIVKLEVRTRSAKQSHKWYGTLVKEMQKNVKILHRYFKRETLRN